jgi:hypothetical protein
MASTAAKTGPTYSQHQTWFGALRRCHRIGFSEMPLAARLFIVLVFILAVIGFWRFPRSDGLARSSIKLAITADCPKKIAHNMNDQCGARFASLTCRNAPAIEARDVRV